MCRTTWRLRELRENLFDAESVLFSESIDENCSTACIEMFFLEDDSLDFPKNPYLDGILVETNILATVVGTVLFGSEREREVEVIERKGGRVGCIFEPTGVHAFGESGIYVASAAVTGMILSPSLLSKLSICLSCT